jgi:hypothetical protein
VRLLARRFARDVVMSTTGPTGAVGVDGFFEDNDFDLFPGETATVIFRPRAPATAEAVRKALHAMSLVDSY